MGLVIFVIVVAFVIVVEVADRYGEKIDQFIDNILLKIIEIQDRRRRR